MLNARIEIVTTSSPYKVNRRMPTILDQYLTGKNDWMIFCDHIDTVLIIFEEIKAVWLILAVISTIICLGLVVGIICAFILVGDDNQHLLSILLGCLFGTCIVVIASNLYLTQRFVVRPLDEFALQVDTYCAEIAETKTSEEVEFRFERSRKCSLFWDSDFKAWINVTTSNPVDLNP
jgi:hypothetical protein